MHINRSLWLALALTAATASGNLESLRRAPRKVYNLMTYYPAFRNDDQYYNVNVTFNNQVLPIFLDTGSGDLFIASDECNVRDAAVDFGLNFSQSSTKVSRNESFGTIVGPGLVLGFQSFLDLSISGRSLARDVPIPLVNYTDPTEFQSGSFSGIWGLSPRNISRNFYYNQRLPLIDTLISHNLLESPCFSLSLPRLGDPNPHQGQLTLGGVEELHSEHDFVSADIIETINRNYDVLAPQSWTAILEGIRFNGQGIPVGKGYIDPQERYVSLVDSGAQKIMFRRPEFEAISAAFVGKTIVQPDQNVYFDCSIPQSLELKYNGVWYPIDPLDIIIPSDHGIVDGIDMCHAALGTWDRDFGDSLNGTPFLRNVITKFDYVSNKMYSVTPRLGFASITNLVAAQKRYSSVYQARLL
ncbi:hypothetical protein KCV07_g9911, partial [Aureobasidium melanogenum]